jgi:hypothetical protein
MIVWQSKPSDLAGKPKAPEVLHCPGVVCASLWMPPRAWLGVDDNGANTEKIEMESQHHPNRSAANYRDPFRAIHARPRLRI